MSMAEICKEVEAFSPALGKELKKSLPVSKDAGSILVLGAFLDTSDFEVEAGLAEKIFRKLGLHVEKKDGLVQILSRGARDIARMLWHASKYATTKDPESKKIVKEIASKKVTKEQFLDFLLKLDTLSLHAVTGPIHMIDALVGWHIWPAVKKNMQKVKDAKIRIQKALEELEDRAVLFSRKIRDKILTYVDKVRSLVLKEA